MTLDRVKMSEYTHVDTRPMVWVSRKIMTIFSILIFFDIGMMVITIMAVTGAETADPRDIVQGAKIDFPPPGEEIQALEIGLVRLLTSLPPFIKLVLTE